MAGEAMTVPPDPKIPREAAAIMARMVRMPPKPHDEMKLGRPSRAALIEDARRLAQECAALPIWFVPPELERLLKPQTPFS